MHPKGAKKNKLAHAIFSNEGPNLNNPDVTKSPKVTPKRYNGSNKSNSDSRICNNDSVVIVCNISSSSSFYFYPRLESNINTYSSNTGILNRSIYIFSSLRLYD